MYFYLGDRSWIAGGGTKGQGRSSADDGTPSRLRMINIGRQLRAQNGRGERDWGSATAIGPQMMGRGITAFPLPSDTAG